VATIRQLEIIRAMFSEALSKGEVFKAEADRAMIRAVAHELLSAENHIKAALGSNDVTAALPNLRSAPPAGQDGLTGNG
jgi:hypothetical protein